MGRVGREVDGERREGGREADGERRLEVLTQHFISCAHTLASMNTHIFTITHTPIHGVGI